MQRQWWKGLAAAVAILAAVALFFALAPRRAALTPGREVPAFRAKVLDGADFFSSDERGKVVCLSFWATWCAYCREELVALDRLAQEYDRDRLCIVSVLKEVHNLDAARTFRDDNALRLPILLDRDGALFASFGVTMLPHTVLIDRRGRLRFVHLGYDRRDLDKYRAELAQLLRER